MLYLIAVIMINLNMPAQAASQRQAQANLWGKKPTWAASQPGDGGARCAHRHDRGTSAAGMQAGKERSDGNGKAWRAGGAELEKNEGHRVEAYQRSGVAWRGQIPCPPRVTGMAGARVHMARG